MASSSRRKKQKMRRRRFFTAAAVLLILIAVLLIGILGKGKNKDPKVPQPDPDPLPVGPTAEELEQQRLEALRKEEYLILANKSHPLSADYKPADLVTVSSIISGVGTKETRQLRKAASDAFEALVKGAAADGLQIKMRTGFRSYSYQESLFKSYADKNGEEKANTFSARAGESEHQTGLALDVSGAGSKWALTYSFGDTAEGKWILAHAHEYGFILRYSDGPKDHNSVGPVTKYVYEPWHIRYVGVEHATEIWEKGITLEEFLQILD